MHDPHFYNTWKKMHVRCYDPTYHSYHRYGGRGIIVDNRWHSFENFKADMLETWSRGLTVERIDNDVPYSRLNCCWLPKGENTKTLLVDPEKLLALYQTGRYLQKELAKLFGTDQPHISRILARGRKRGKKL
jgi:hypothetical protein